MPSNFHNALNAYLFECILVGRIGHHGVSSMSESSAKYTGVAVTHETRRLIRHIANATDKQMMDVIVAGVKLLQEKHQIPDPPVVRE